MSLHIEQVREQFPALNRPAIFFDNPGGTQIAKAALDRINQYLIKSNANHEGVLPPASPQTPSLIKPIAPWLISTILRPLRKLSLATT